MNPNSEDLSLRKLRTATRKVFDPSQRDLVRTSTFQPGQSLPLIVEPVHGDLDLAAWCRAHLDFVEERLLQHGGLLFRNARLRTVPEFEAFIKTIYGGLLEYQDRVQPRSQVSSNVYTSTEYPPELTIELHNESSYAFTWPLKIFFFCVQPAEEGGETPLADCRRILERMAPAVRDRFVEKQVCYVRNLGGGLGIDWRTAFQTDSREEMEAFCRQNGIGFEWQEGDRVRTTSVRPIVSRHPRTGESVWFNALISSHQSTLPAAVREALLAELSPEELPKNAFYGDGTPIEPETLAEVRRAVDEETVTFPWQAGDILMLDNMLAAHGRRPYRGPRKVVVGMAQPVSLGTL